MCSTVDNWYCFINLSSGKALGPLSVFRPNFFRFCLLKGNNKRQTVQNARKKKRKKKKKKEGNKIGWS